MLQKLRNTFSQLKNGKSSFSAETAAQPASITTATPPAQPHQQQQQLSLPDHSTHVPSHNNSHIANDTTTFRFGPLVWRTSKERRKTKSHRRDKCNSGDSGIQVELDGSDEPMPVASASTASSAAVRRANSAKVASASAAAATATTSLAHLRRQGSECTVRPGAMPRRSHSQPTGLDRLTATGRNGGTATTAQRNTGDHHSDSDSEDCCASVSPYHRPPHLHQPDQKYHLNGGSATTSYAEVVYAFRPDSNQELRLERGALVEVLHCEPGPWWWGRLKVDAVASSDSSPTEGWFPKDFVRLIERRSGAAAPKLQSSASFAEATNCDIRLGDRLAVETTASSSFKRAASESPPAVSPRPLSVQNSEMIRLNVIKELLDTEVNYVNLLAALCRG